MTLKDFMQMELLPFFSLNTPFLYVKIVSHTPTVNFIITHNVGEIYCVAPQRETREGDFSYAIKTYVKKGICIYEQKSI